MRIPPDNAQFARARSNERKKERKYKDHHGHAPKQSCRWSVKAEVPKTTNYTTIHMVETVGSAHYIL